MLKLDFNAISERTPGEKWQKLFRTHWPAYKAWLEGKGAAHKPDLKTSRENLKRYMPELMPTYEHLCALAGDDLVAARFFTGYRPPAYITGCSQAVWQKNPQLVRNYDYHPHLSEGTLLHSAWNGKQVIATGDCLLGVVDGMNEDGLVASLTFGGRKAVGDGFGIPFILRYVLEFCGTIDEAVEALQRVPSHMAYNVTLLDKRGNFKTLQLAPGHKAKVTDAPVATNHQGAIDWPEHARFSKTLERENFLRQTLQDDGQDAEGVANAFLHPPLFNTRYSDGFGTVYTAVYRPAQGYMELRWTAQKLKQSFGDFKEGTTIVRYSEKTEAIPAYSEAEYQVKEYAPSGEADYWTEYGKSWASGNPTELAKQVAKTIADAMGMAKSGLAGEMLEIFTAETKKRGQVPWEMLADLSAELGQPV